MSDIILPNGEKADNLKQKDLNDIDPEVFLNHDKYITELNISCMDFLKGQGLQPGQMPRQKLLDFWASKLQEFYQLKANSEEVMAFFRVPEKFQERLAQKQYSVRELILDYNAEYMVLKIQLTLTLNDTPWIPGVTDNLKK